MVKSKIFSQKCFNIWLSYISDRVLTRIPLTQNTITYGSASGEEQKRCGAGRIQIRNPRIDRSRSTGIPGSPGGSRSRTQGLTVLGLTGADELTYLEVLEDPARCLLDAQLVCSQQLCQVPHLKEGTIIIFEICEFVSFTGTAGTSFPKITTVGTKHISCKRYRYPT
jgi:hypothetical protein